MDLGDQGLKYLFSYHQIHTKQDIPTFPEYILSLELSLFGVSK